MGMGMGMGMGWEGGHGGGARGEGTGEGKNRERKARGLLFVSFLCFSMFYLCFEIFMEMGMGDGMEMGMWWRLAGDFYKRPPCTCCCDKRSRASLSFSPTNVVSIARKSNRCGSKTKAK